jgi:hypothetical protein
MPSPNITSLFVIVLHGRGAAARLAHRENLVRAVIMKRKRSVKEEWAARRSSLGTKR